MDYLDEKTANNIERRRRMEEERKQRIFNEKTRVKGIDLDGIDEQIRMKKELKEQEEARERAIAEELSNIERQVQILALRHEEAKKQVAADILHENQQLANYRRTQTPPKQIDMDRTAVGASSMLIFGGEDQQAKQRSRMQAMAQLHENDELAKVKAQRTKAEKDADLLYEQQTRAMRLKIQELEKDHMRAKSNVKAADRDYNKYLGDMKRDRDQHARLQENTAGVQQVQLSLHDPMLTETGDVTSSVDPSRVVPYAYKGMSPSQRRAISDEQEMQRRAKEEAKREKDEEERQWAAQQQAVNRAAMMKEREVQRTREDMNRKLQNEHTRMAREKSDRYDNLNKNVYANRASEDFFSQFNTSSR